MILILPSIKKYRVRLQGKSLTLLDSHNHEVDFCDVHVDVARAVHTAVAAHRRGEYYVNP